jgi:hypothetical protein
VRGVTFQPIQDADRLESWIPSAVSEDDPEGAPPLSRSLRQGEDFDSPDSLQSGRFIRNFNPATDRLTLTEVRRKILEQTNVFRPEDVIPVPCHPDSLAMAYALKLNGKVTPLTSMIPPEVLINGAANTILYEQEPAVRDGLFKLFATNHSPESSAGTLRELLCCLPKIWLPNALSTEHVGAAGAPFLPGVGRSGDVVVPTRSMNHVGTAASSVPPARSAAESQPSLTYENIFRIIIMQFIDAHSFDVRSVKKTCVHIVHPDGRLIPFDTYNLFYRDDLERTRLEPLRRRAEGTLMEVS